MSEDVETELCNEEDVMREGGVSNGVRDEVGNDVVGSQCKGAIPICPIGRGCVRVVVVEGDVTAQKVGYLLDEALREESESGVSFGYGRGHGGDACFDVNQLGIEVFPGKGWRMANGG